jgi:hypothetical protein
MHYCRIILPHLYIIFMFNRKLIFFLLIIFTLTEVENAFSQDSTADHKKDYSLMFYGGGGLSYYIINPHVPLHVNTTVNRYSPVYSARIMWLPDHRLRFGLETGWMHMYKYNITADNYSGKLELTAVPLLIVWSMKIGKCLNLFAATGTYFIRTTLDFDGTARSSSLSLGWMLAASYDIKLSESIFLTPELKWYNPSESDDQMLSLQMLVAWKFFKW